MLRKIVARFEDLRSDSAAEIATLQTGIEAANGRIVTFEEDSTITVSQIAAREETTVAEMEDLRATILDLELQIGENADTNEEADRVSTELLKKCRDHDQQCERCYLETRERGVALKTQDLRSMDGATTIMAQRTTSYQDAEKVKLKDLVFKSRKQEEDQSRALGKTNEKLSQLEAQKKEDVDRLNEELGQPETQKEQEANRLNVELGQLKTRTS